MGVAFHTADVAYFGAFQAKQHMVYALKMLADDVQTGLGQEMMDIGDPASNGVFNRHHGQRGPALLNAEQHILKTVTGERLKIRPCGFACGM